MRARMNVGRQQIQILLVWTHTQSWFLRGMVDWPMPTKEVAIEHAFLLRLLAMHRCSESQKVRAHVYIVHAYGYL